MRGLADGWTKLPAELREAARIAGQSRWREAISGQVETRSESAAISHAALCAEVADPELGGVILGLLDDPRSRVAAAAEAAWVRVARTADRRDVGGWELAETTKSESSRDSSVFLPPMSHGREIEHDERERWCVHIAAAVRGFSNHRKRGVMLAAIVFLDPVRIRGGCDLARWFTRPDPESLGALKGALRWGAPAVVRERAWEWLWREDLTLPAASRLSTATTLEEHERVLSRWHLVARPSRCEALSGVEIKNISKRRGGSVVGIGGARESSVLPTGAQICQLSAGARRGVVTFAVCCGGRSPAKRAAAIHLLADSEAMVRHAAARSWPRRGLEDWCFDADERVARTAMARWSLGGTRGSTLRSGSGTEEANAQVLTTLMHLSRSKHATVRAWSEQDLDALGSAWSPGLWETLRMRMEMRENPLTLIAGVSETLKSGSDEERVRVLAMSRRLGILRQIEAELCGVVRGSDGKAGVEAHRAAAMAVAALAECGTEMSRSVIMGALRHHDSRVRANAVEAMTRRSRRDSRRVASSMIELKKDAHHRVRANAIRSFIVDGSDEANAATELAAMLNDERAAHRLAGAWLAGRVLAGSSRGAFGRDWQVLSASVRELSLADADHAVRARAADSLGRIERAARVTALDGFGRKAVAA